VDLTRTVRERKLVPVLRAKRRRCLIRQHQWKPRHWPPVSRLPAIAEHLNELMRSSRASCTARLSLWHGHTNSKPAIDKTAAHDRLHPGGADLFFFFFAVGDYFRRLAGASPWADPVGRTAEPAAALMRPPTPEWKPSSGWKVTWWRRDLWPLVVVQANEHLSRFGSATRSWPPKARHRPHLVWGNYSQHGQKQWSGEASQSA